MRIVVIIADTFRFDHLGAHGLKAIHTANLDALARRGADFQRCYTGSFPTRPNRADIHLGKFYFPCGDWEPLPREGATLAERLGEKGFLTQWVGDNPHMLERQGYFHRGFTAAVQIRGQEGDMFFTRQNRPNPKIMSDSKTRSNPKRHGMTLVNVHEWLNQPRYESDRFAPRTAELACRWIEENYKADSTMLWVEFFDPHEPWDVPEYFWRRYDPHYRGKIDIRHPNYGPASDYTAAELRSLAAHYAGEVTLVDKSIGRILRQIDDCGIADDTVVVFTTDHGICLGEHNRTGKSNLHPRDDRAWPMFEEIAHIPLVIYLPGMRPRRPRGFCQPVDLTATLLALVGAKRDRSLHGRSLLGLATGRSGGAVRDCAVSAAWLGRLSRRTWVTPMLYAGKWAYCPLTERMGAGGLLFDMAGDREQKRNVVKKFPGVAARLRRKMVEVLEELETPAGHISELMGE